VTVRIEALERLVVLLDDLNRGRADPSMASRTASRSMPFRHFGFRMASASDVAAVLGRLLREGRTCKRASSASTA
jgi:hypothetical protein